MELSHRLKEVGQELSFHFSTNPDIYKAFASASAQHGSKTETFELRSREMNTALRNLNMHVVREMLLEKETSQGLKEKLLVTEQ